MTETAEYPRISDNPYQQEHYEKCRRQGTSHKLASIFATGRAPALKTNTTFMANRGSGLEGNPVLERQATRAARAAGVNPEGKWYCSQIAEHHNDPNGWIESQDDLKNKLQARGLGCTGSIEVKAPPSEPIDIAEQPYKVADDLIQEEVNQTLAGETVSEKEHTDLWDKVAEKSKGNY